MERFIIRSKSLNSDVLISPQSEYHESCVNEWTIFQIIVGDKQPTSLT